MTTGPPPDWPHGWNSESWAAAARDYAANRKDAAPLEPQDWAGPVPVGVCPTCGGDPCPLPGFCARSRAVDRRNARLKEAPSERDLRRERLSRSDVSLDAMWNELNRVIPMRAAVSSVEALMIGLRRAGVAALKEPKVRKIIAELDRGQYLDVADKLLNPKPHNTPWSEQEVEAFMRLYKEVKR